MSNEVKIVRVTTVPISLKVLLTGQLNFMKEKGFEMLAISADGKEVEEVVAKNNVPHLVFPLTRKITPLIDLHCLLKMTVFFLQHKPTIVHTHTPKAGLIGMLAAKLAGVPVKIHTVAGLPLMTTKGFKRKLLKQIERLTYWAADTVLPNAKSMKQFIIKEKLVGEDKLHIIGEGSTNGFDENQFNRNNIDDEKLELIKSKINFDATKFYLLFVGRMVADKGIIELIESFISLKKKYKNLELIILGEYEESLSPLPDFITDEIKSNNSIHHLGWQDDVQYYLAFANLLIHPSHREGFPNIVLQAAAMSCPIMCTTIPGNIDIVYSNEAGSLFKPKDKFALIDTFEIVFANYDVAQYKSSILSQHVWKNFPRKLMHERIYQYYFSKLEEQQNVVYDFAFQ